MKAQSISISVIIPAYNASRTIRRTLDSVVGQSAINFIKEIIIVNDGSADSTEQVIQEYIKFHSTQQPVIKLFTTKNKGVSNARNVGINKAQGSWMALLDSDDYWSQDKIEKQINAIRNDPTIKFIGTNSQKDSPRNGKKIDEGLYKINLVHYLFKTSPSTCSILFEKKVLKSTGYFDVSQKYAEDANLFMKIIHLYGGYYLSEPLLFLDDKPTFGHAGLSSNLRAMHLGCIKNITEAYSLGYISLFMRIILILWEDAKYLRRIALTFSRRLQLESRKG